MGVALPVATSLTTNVFIGGVSVFWPLLVATYFFASGGFSVTVPYVTEIWPSRLRATGLGSAYGVGSLGKIVGPLGLGLVLGTSKVTVDAVFPAFCHLGAFVLLTGVVFVWPAEETRGRRLEDAA